MTMFRWTLLALVMLCLGCRTGGAARVDNAWLDTARVDTAARRQPMRSTPTAIADADRVDNESDNTAAVIQLTSGEISEPANPDMVSDRPLSLSASLTLPQSIALALEQNPDLITLRQSENVGSAALGVAQTYPFNPFVQVQATPYQEARSGGPGTTYHYVLLMQTIQLAHQQQFREEGAASALNSTRWNIHQAELQNVAQTERLYFNLLYQRGLLELANASHGNNQSNSSIPWQSNDLAT